MRKKFLVLVVTLIMTFSLTGCMFDNQIPELPEDEMRQVEEYAAQLLLKYDKYYDDGTLSEEEIARQESMMQQAAETRAEVAQQKAEQAQTSDTSSTEENSDSSEPATPVYQDIDEFLGMDSFDIECTGYMVCDSYPVDTSENDWQGMATATNGNKLVVYSMLIVNKTSMDQMLDMASKDIRASIKINGNIKKSPLTTLLTNDFLMYRGNVAPGDSVELVIVIELSESDAQNITSSVLTLKYNGERMETSL